MHSGTHAIVKMVFGSNKEKKNQQLEKFANLERRLETLEQALISKTVENEALKKDLTNLELKVNSLEETNLEQNQDLEELREIVEAQNTTISNNTDKCRTLESKKLELEKQSEDLDLKINAIKRKQNQDLDHLLEQVERMNVLQDGMAKDTITLSEDINNHGVLMKQGIQDLCQTVSVMSDQNQDLIESLEQAMKGHLKSSLLATSSAIGLTSQSLMKHQLRINEISNMLPSLLQKVLDIQVKYFN